MIETIFGGTASRWMALAVPGERIFILYLLTAFILAAFTWLHYHYNETIKDKPEGTKKGLMGYIFDKNVYFHKSAIQDYIFFVVNALIYMGLIAQLLLSVHLFTIFFTAMLNKIFGIPETPVMEVSVLTITGYTIVFVLFMDFAVFVTHYLQHKIPVLWQFHQVHHSAEVLTPITVYRMHPVDLFFTGLIGAILVGFGYAGYVYLTGAAPTAFEIMGLNIVVFVFYIFGYNLRHSHIWLSYPPWLSNILVSPAQHQIHHSIEPKHWDRNMGLIFSFWDKLFGTLYVPEKYEDIRYGINKEDPNPFKNVWDMYIMPFKNAWALMVPEGSTRKAAMNVLLFLLISVGVYWTFVAVDKELQAQVAPLRTVHMEDLTWTEIQLAMDEKGYDTVIIPTGGTEQNGAHVTLGKHNRIVYYTAGKIAESLGRTFVAPVIPYVPEEVHMEYAGTVSVSEETLETILLEAGESYIRHGMKYIFFIGDSVGNQDPQARAAERLQKKHPDVTIAHIGDYYSKNGQFEWLQNEKGYAKNTIGGHAGIRDTSEMMVVDGENGVRKYPKYVAGRATGHNGDITKANKRIGEKMLQMKINAAVKQIKTMTGRYEDIESADIVPH